MLSILVFAALLASAPASASSPRCERVGDTFYLSGRIDAELAACVEQEFAQGISEIVVNSQGGNADEALAIAERLEGAQFTITVRGHCSSGCANLFLPLAERVVIEPGSYVVLHGTLDPQQIQRESIEPRDRWIARFMRENPSLDRALLERNYDAETTRNVELLRRVNAFTERNRIPKGWLFYREPGDRGLGRYVSGRLQRRNPEYVLVEEALMRSCLGHLLIEPYQAGLEEGLASNKQRFDSFRRARGVRSGDLVCSPLSNSSE